MYFIINSKKTPIWFQVLKPNMAEGVCINVTNLAVVPVMVFQLYIHMYVYLMFQTTCLKN